MKKRNWTEFKKLLFMYLAISKMLYWIKVIDAVDGFEGILRRFLDQDIVVIILVVFIYFFDKKLVMKQKKWNNVLVQIVLIVGSYVSFVVIMVTYAWVTSWTLSMPFNVGVFLSTSMFGWTIIFFAISGAVVMQDNFKRKEASKYALGIQITNIKLEMLKVLLDDGALSQEEFDKQKANLLEL